MKELSIKEKAKRYDEAIENGKQILNTPYTAHWDTMKEVVEHLLPELKESEDEKIRKALIDFFNRGAENGEQTNGVHDKDILAWFEKQGNPAKLSEDEQNRFAKGVLTSCALSFINYLDAHKYEGKMCVSNGECEDIENAFHNAIWDKLHRYYCKYIEKQGEQKPADKVEPKFKQGEWIIFNGLILYVDEVVQGYYRTISIDGIPNSYDWDIDNAARLWTIQEAKAGDVLATKTGGVFIYKELLYDKPFAYCGVDKFGVFKDCNCGDGLDWTPYLSDVTPATKEQRNLLFTKMKEAGYEWDAEKKELKKVEQKPAWSEEDDRMMNLY